LRTGRYRPTAIPGGPSLQTRDIKDAPTIIQYGIIFIDGPDTFDTGQDITAKLLCVSGQGPPTTHSPMAPHSSIGMLHPPNRDMRGPSHTENTIPHREPMAAKRLITDVQRKWFHALKQTRNPLLFLKSSWGGKGPLPHGRDAHAARGTQRVELVPKGTSRSSP
jgi:hypothetical protein